MGDRRQTYWVLMGRPEKMRPLGRPGRKWEYNIKKYLQDMGREAWSGLIWLRIMTAGRLL
jgi:hypothetical protein